jgi:hypothetical protein
LSTFFFIFVYNFATYCGQSSANECPRAQAHIAGAGADPHTDEEKDGLGRQASYRPLPAASVSQVARKHGIVTGMLLRWRVPFGVAQKKRGKLAPVAFGDGAPATLPLQDFVQPPEGMVAIDLPDGRRVFAPDDSDPDAVRAELKRGRRHHADRSGGREGALAGQTPVE